MLPVLDTNKLQEMQWFCSFMGLNGHQLGKNLQYAKLQVDLKKPHSNKVPVTQSLGKNNNIFYLFLQNRLRVSRSSSLASSEEDNL